MEEDKHYKSKIEATDLLTSVMSEENWLKTSTDLLEKPDGPPVADNNATETSKESVNETSFRVALNNKNGCF